MHDEVADEGGPSRWTWRGARAALPAAPPDTRLSFASRLTGLAERTASGAVKTVIAAEAVAYADER